MISNDGTEFNNFILQEMNYLSKRKRTSIDTYLPEPEVERVRVIQNQIHMMMCSVRAGRVHRREFVAAFLPPAVSQEHEPRTRQDKKYCRFFQASEFAFNISPTGRRSTTQT